MEPLMGITNYVRQVKPRQNKSVNHLEKIQSLYEKMMHPDELVKYGGRKAKTLQKAIEDGTPLETNKGTFPLTWINDSDKKKFASAIGGDGASDYWPSLKSGTKFKN